MIKSEIFASVLRDVCEVTGISERDIMSKSKSEEIVDARHLLVVTLRRSGYYPGMIAERLHVSGQRSAIFASEEVLIPDLILLIEPGAIPVKASKLVCPISYCLRANSISRSLKFSLSITFYVTNTYLLLSTK